MTGIPHVYRLGGNERDGLLSIQRRGDRLVVVSWPEGVPLPATETILYDEAFDAQRLNEVLKVWDDRSLKRQMMSHVGEDVVKFEPGELDEQAN